MSMFVCGTKLVSGPGSVSYLGQLGSQRLLLVSDPYFVQNGTAQRLLQLSGAGETRIFDRVIPDPTVEVVAEGTAALREFQPDTVAALGGGSAMDCAKAMVYFAKQPVRLVAIPTTSGSGSEVTDFAVLTCKHVKHPLVDGQLRPQVAILDGELLKELPRGLIADAGFDVLNHALEAYVAKDGGAVTDALAKEAFVTAFALLPASYGGKTEVRQKLHDAAAMAGMAFTQAGLGLCHAMAHSLGGKFHVPHGRLGAILLPAVVGCNANLCASKYASLARAAGLGGAADAVAVRNLKNGLIRLRRELGLPETLAQAGIDPRQVRQQAALIAERALADPCCRTNPLPVANHMIHGILETVAGRG